MTGQHPQRAHFIGVGGIGMSALASLLLAEGWSVTGSDLRTSPLTDALAAKGATIFQGHHPDNLRDPNIVIITAAIRADNPELIAAQARGVPILKRSELLGRVMAGKRGIAIAGTHGKTTTTALAALILVQAGLDPTVFVGGEVPELAGNFRLGASDLLIAEADEFDGSFLRLAPEIAAVTNIEAEHLDFYGDFSSMVEAFRRFLASVPPDGSVIYCADDPVLADLGKEAATYRAISYGILANARWRAQYVAPNGSGGHDFLALFDGTAFGEFSLRIPGRHNVTNSLAAIAVGHLLDVPLDTMQSALSAFGGVRRRFQVIGTEAGVTIVDDYAHHPTEIRATLAAARARYPRRSVLCLFQPHTYSRTRLLLHLFGDAFQDADRVFVSDIYAAREENSWNVSSQELVSRIDHPAVEYVGGLDEAIARVTGYLHSARRGDPILITMGAGDVNAAGPRILEDLRHDAAR